MCREVCEDSAADKEIFKSKGVVGSTCEGAAKKPCSDGFKAGVDAGAAVTLPGSNPAPTTGSGDIAKVVADLLMVARLMVLPVHGMHAGLRSDVSALHTCAADSADPSHTACRVVRTLNAVSLGDSKGTGDQEAEPSEYAFGISAIRLHGWLQGPASSPWGLDLEVAACTALRQIFVGHAESHAAESGADDMVWADWQRLRYGSSSAEVIEEEADATVLTSAARTAIELRLWEQELLSSHARYFQDRATAAMAQLLHRD
jgi:hypothetical protein